MDTKFDNSYILGNGSIAVRTGLGKLVKNDEIVDNEQFPYISLSWMDKDLPIGKIEKPEETIEVNKTVLIIKNLESLEVLQRSLDYCRSVLTKNE